MPIGGFFTCKRNKYDFSFRLWCVKAVLSDKTLRSVAKVRGIEESILRQWFGFYEQEGKEGPKAGRYQNYDFCFKLKVLKTKPTKGLFLRSAAVRFDIPDARTNQK